MKKTRTRRFLKSNQSFIRCFGMFLLMSIFAMGVVSCWDDDDDSSPKSELRKRIVGKWVIQCVKRTKKSSVTEAGNPGQQGSNPDNMEFTGYKSHFYQKWDNGTELTFNDNGTCEDSSGGGNQKWDVTPEGDLKIGDEEFEYDEKDKENSIVETEDEEYHYYWCWFKVEGGEEEDENREEHCLKCELPVEPEPNVPPIFPGPTPPNIEGCYLLKPYTVVYCSDGWKRKGEEIDEEDYIRFSNQNMKKNTLDYENNGFSVKKGNLCNHESGSGAYIQGKGNNFTVFFRSQGSISGTSVTLDTYTVISGTKTSTGIKNLYYMTMCVDKKGDSGNHYMGVGVYRVFRDGDGDSPKTEWRTRAMQDRAMEVMNIYPWQRYTTK